MINKPDFSRPAGLRIGHVLVTHVEFSHTTPEPLELSDNTPHKVTGLKLGAQLKVTDDKKQAVLRVRVETDMRQACARIHYYVHEEPS